MIDAGRGPIINMASLTAERCVDRYPLAAYSAAKAVNTGQHLLVDGGRPAYRASLAWPRGLVSVPWIEEDAALAGGSSRPLRWRQRRPLTARWPATSHSKSVMQTLQCQDQRSWKLHVREVRQDHLGAFCISL